MEKNFDEINSMLESIRGGHVDSGLFGGPTDPEGKRNCIEFCTENCKNGVGTTVGTVRGTNTPDPGLPGGPVTNL